MSLFDYPELTVHARLRPDPAPSEPAPFCHTQPPRGAWSPPKREAMLIRPQFPPTPKPVAPQGPVVHNVMWRTPEDRAASAAWAREARATLDLSQATLCKLIGVSKGMWASYECGIVPSERVKWAVEALLDGTRTLPPGVTRSALRAGPELAALVERVLSQPGMTIDTLSQSAGCETKHIRAWLGGRRGITPQRLARLHALAGEGS